jgi:hypothetical protein
MPDIYVEEICILHRHLPSKGRSNFQSAQYCNILQSQQLPARPGSGCGTSAPRAWPPPASPVVTSETIPNQRTNMKIFKDSFLDESADVHNTPRRIIKASLKLAMTDQGSPTRLAPDGRNEDDSREFERKKSEAVADKGTRNLRSGIRPSGAGRDQAGPMRF